MYTSDCRAVVALMLVSSTDYQQLSTKKRAVETAADENVNLVVDFIDVSTEWRYQLFPANSQSLQQKHDPLNPATKTQPQTHKTNRYKISTNTMHLFALFTAYCSACGDQWQKLTDIRENIIGCQQ